MLTDVNEAVTHQTEEEIVEEPFYVSWNYWQIAWIVYGSGVFILLVHLLVEMVRIWRLKRWGTCTTDADGICIVRNNEVVSPFSFYRMIFINRKLEGEVLRVVLLHEKAHIRNHHYRDTLFIEGLSILCWFNPLILFFCYSVVSLLICTFYIALILLYVLFLWIYNFTSNCTRCCCFW